MKTVLTIAGSDTSAGAGIQQDLKTITAMGLYALTVPTALTAQNTRGVRRVMSVPEDMIRDQIDSIFDDIRVDAVKIGMIPDIACAEVFRCLDIGKSLCKNTAFTLDFARAHAFFGDVYDARHAAGFYVVFTIYGMTNYIIHFILRNNFFQKRQKYTAKSSKT